MEHSFFKTSLMIGALGCAALAIACSDETTASSGTTTPQGGNGGDGASGGFGGSGANGGNGGNGGMGGSPPGADWSCIGQNTAPVYDPNGADATGTVTLNELVANMPLADITINVCAKTDVDCAAVVGSQITDAAGMATMVVPTSAAHYLEFTGAGIPDHLAYSNGPPMNAFTVGWAPINSANLGAFVALAGSAADPTRGHVGVSAFDCAGVLAAGVEVVVDLADANTAYGYFDTNGVPAAGQTETTADGRLGIANVPPGQAEITARVAATQQVISTRTVTIRAASVTYPPGLDPTPEAL